MTDTRPVRAGKAAAAPQRFTFVRHRIVFTILRPLFGIFLWFAFRFKGERYQQENNRTPYFVLSNHNGALDPFMIAQSFRQPIYFVASDHIFRLGWVSRLITWLVAPIPIVKSQIDIRAIRQILSIQKEGGSVCLFPSGNRSFTGPEMPIPAATGKLVKQLKGTVLLYRFEGGYLTSPRWARSHRRGRMSGRVVRELSVAEIASMTVDEINRLLVTTLDADPYLEPAVDRIFHGKRLAEHLERVLFVCPRCLRLNTLRSQDDQLFCDCGLAVRYLPNGTFSPVNVESQNIVEKMPHVKAFDQFQKTYLSERLLDSDFLDRHRVEPFFQDENQCLSRAERASRSIPVLTGSMRLFSDRLEIADAATTMTFPIDSIGMLSVHGPQVLQFHDAEQDHVFEVRSEKPRSAYRYMVLFELIQSMKSRVPVSNPGGSA